MNKEHKQRYFDKDSIKKEKVRLIFFPFLVLTIGTLIVFSIVYWLLVYELEMFNSSTVGFSLVFISAFIPFLINKRLNLIERKNKDTRFVWLVIMLTMLVPGLFLQDYIDNTIGKNSTIQNISEIKNSPKTRFYDINQYYVNPDIISHFTYINHQSRYNKKYLQTYCIAPVYQASEGISHNPLPIAWIGKMYKSDQFNPENEDKIMDKFVSDSRRKFAAEIQKQINYFERISYNEENGYYRAMERLLPKSYSAFNEIILIPHYNLFEERAGNKFTWAFYTFLIGSFIFLIIVLVIPFNEMRLEAFLTGKPYRDPMFPDPKPSKVVKGKIIQNDKIILIENNQKEKLRQELKEICRLYNADFGTMFLRLTEIEKDTFTITFPYDIDFEPFCYLINYICYPVEGKIMPNITAWTKAIEGDTWINEEIVGKNIMMYVPENDNEHDNIYVTTEDNECYKFNFCGTTEKQTEIVRRYSKPEYQANSIPAIKWNEDFS